MTKSKEWIEERKHNKLCTHCDNSTNGFVRCDSCREKGKAYSKKRRRELRSQGICPKCQKNKLQEEERYCAYCRVADKRLSEMAQWVWEYKTRVGCLKCHERRPFALHFHHRNPKDKSFDLSRISKKWAFEEVKNEVLKCDVLCANCHACQHNGEGFMGKNIEIKSNYNSDENNRVYSILTAIEMACLQLELLVERYGDIDYVKLAGDAKKIRLELREKHEKINPDWYE